MTAMLFAPPVHAADSVGCPQGWTASQSIDGWNRCFQLQLARLPAVDTEFYCENILRLSADSSLYVAKALSVHTAAENLFALALAAPAFAIPSIHGVLLGGVWSLGELAWFDGTTASPSSLVGGNHSTGATAVPYTNWSSDASLGDGGCIAMASDGSWYICSCTSDKLPFVCAVDLTTTAPPTPSPSSPPPSTSAPPPATATPSPGAYAPRPSVQQPMPPCPAGWTGSNGTGKCYLVVSHGNARQPDAQAQCTAMHPSAALTSVLGPDEDALIATLLQDAASSAAQTAAGAYLAYVGGTFMDGGNIGVWLEDSVWYPTWTGASSPSWPTPTSGYYTNWMPGEPSTSFGCLALNSSNGQWAATSCQSTLPFVCAFLNDGATWAPTTTVAPPTPTVVPTVATPQPPPSQVPVNCPTGWFNATASRMCVRVVSGFITAADLEQTCNQMTPRTTASGTELKAPYLVHAASPATDEANDAIATALAQSSIPLALIGVSYVENGTYGMYLDGTTEYSATFVLNHFAIGQPTSPGGCVMTRPDGRWVFIPCGLEGPAYVCSFSWDAYVTSSNVPASTPAPDAGPPSTNAPVVGLAQRIAALNGVTSLSVAKGTVGTYTVTSGGGSVEGLVLLFSPTPSCDGATRGDLLASVYQGTIRVLHTLATPNGTLCVSGNGSTFVATPIRFQVVPAVVAGFLSLSQNLYAPPLKRTNFSTDDVVQALVFGRRSNAVLQLVGSGPVDTAVRFVRFASSASCQANLYTISERSIPVVDGIASVLSTFIIPQAAVSRNPQYLDSNGATPPPREYAVCVSLDNITYTRLVNASAQLVDEFLSVQSLGRITRANAVTASTQQLVVPQYAASRVALIGDGLSVGMQALLSFNRSLCPRLQQAPSFSLYATSDVPTHLTTVMPIMSTLVEEASGVVQRAYVQLNLNHTGMWGADELLPFQDWYLCVARSATEPFVATGLSIRIQRQSIGALAVSGDVPVSPQLNVNTGFAGLVRIWGVDTTDWSTETVSNLQVSLAEMPSGGAALPALAQQCADTSTFYGARAMSVVEGTSSNSSFDDVHHSGALSSSLAVVFPPSFFQRQTTRRMRLCLSIPRSYDRLGARTFAATTATIDVRPVQLMFVGRFGISSVASNVVTQIAIAENSDNVVFPLYGYGLQADMSLFLSEEPCMSQAIFQDRGYLGRVSKMNITIAAPYDVPVSFRVNNSQATAAAAPVYMVLTKAAHTNTPTANGVFGVARRPLNLCIWAPQTHNEVYPTPFSFVVTRPRIQSVVDATGRSPAMVTYGSFTDLLVVGVGLQGNRTVLVPAIDCANESTFLWKYPVALSPVPSLLTFSEANATQRFSDYATQNSSWFIPLNQQQTTRVGTQVAATDAGRLITRFQWCVNYDRTDPATYAFEPTGVGYQLLIPAVTGFVNNNPADGAARVTTLYVPREDPLVGQWSKAAMVGPLVDAATATGNPLYMFFTEPLIPCARLRTTILASNASDRFVVAINGTMLLLPSHVNVAGTYKVCVSMLYPSSFDGVAAAVESTLQFIELPTLRVSVVDTQFKLFTMNSSLSVAFEQGESPMISVDGVGLSIRARIRLMSSTAVAAGVACGSTPMPGGVGDLVVRQVFPMQRLGVNQNAQFFVALEHQESRLIPTGTYYVCFLPNPAEPWIASGSIRVNVLAHQRRPTLYNYFLDDDRFDVAELRAVAPTKLVLPQSSGEPGVVNIVGTTGREVSLQLLCYNGSTNTTASPVVSCGDNKRVMFVRPMEDDSDPCFIDDEDEDWENVRGPFLMRSSVLTVPRITSTGYAYVPDFDDAWVMCVETSPDYWRRPTAPMALLQFTSQRVTAVRVDGPDTPDNSTAQFPSLIANTLPGNGAKRITLYAGDVSQVVYLNGFGIQYGLLVRFGVGSCTTDGGNGTSTAAGVLPNNRLLYTSPLVVGDDSGSIVIPAHYCSVSESQLLAMCISDASGVAFLPTSISLAVLPSRIVRDASYAQYSDGHVLTDAFQDTLVLPLLSRGLVDLGVLRTSASASAGGGGEAVPFGTGALVMFSSTCLYSSHGLPYVQVQTESLVSVSYQHTGAPTSTLKVCVRRLWEFQDNTGTLRTVFATPLFVDTGLTFRVLNVSVVSVSAHARKVGIEAQHDINHLLFHPRGRDLLVPLTFAFNPIVDRTTGSNAIGSTIMDSLDDANTLAFFGLAQFRVGRPCYQGAPSAVAAAVGSLSIHTATFDHGRVTVIPDGTEGFHVPLRVDAEFAADPWNPYSMCFSVDGGRSFISVGVAYFTADWEPTLYVLDSGATASTASSGAAFTQDITIYEATSVFTEFSDARYDTRILTNTAPDFVDSDLSRELNRFTVDALWTGFIGDVGYAQEGVLYIPAEIVSDGEAIDAASAAAAALVSTDPTLLTFTYDIAAANISTGVTLTIAPMQLRCLDGGLSNILVNPEETGRVFDIATSDVLTAPTAACGLGINDGSMFRLAANCSAPQRFVGDIVVDASLRLILPPVLPFLTTGTYQLCLKKFLPMRVSASLGVDAEFIATRVSMELTPRTVIDQIDGLSSGLLIGFYGDDFSVPVSGAGVSSTSVILSLVDVGTTTEDAKGHTDATCEPILGYVDERGRPRQNNTLLDWFPVTVGAMWTIPATANTPSSSLQGVAPTETRMYLICASFDFGLSFQKAGNGLYYSLVPPTVVGLASYGLPTGSQLYDPAKATANGVQYLRFLPAADNSTALSASPSRVLRSNQLFDYFFSNDVPQQGLTFLGNGIGKRSHRSAPLSVALVDTSVVGYACNGFVPPSAILRTVRVDGRTGKLLPTTTMPLMPSAIAQERPGTTYMLCTSADQYNFYSPNVPSFLSSDAGWLATAQKPLQRSSLELSAVASTRLSQYAAQPTVLAAQRSMAATRYVSDMTLSFGVLLRPVGSNRTTGGAASTASPVNFTLPLLQCRLARALGDGYASSSVAIHVNAQSGRHYNLSDATDAPFYVVTIRLLTEGRNATSGAVLSKPFMYARLWGAILAQNSTAQIMQSLVDSDSAVVAPVAVNATFDDGTAIRSSSICTTQSEDGASPSTTYETYSDRRFSDMGATVATLCSIPSLLIYNEPIIALTDDDLQPKSTWSAIPIVMVMPFLLVFGTYHLYAKFFDIITPEELAAREQREGEDMALRREKRTLALKGTAANRSVLDTMPGVGVEIQDSFVTQGQELKATVGKGLGTVGAAVTSAATNVQAALTSGSSDAAPAATTANDAASGAPAQGKRE